MQHPALLRLRLREFDLDRQSELLLLGHEVRLVELASCHTIRQDHDAEPSVVQLLEELFTLSLLVGESDCVGGVLAGVVGGAGGRGEEVHRHDTTTCLAGGARDRGEKEKVLHHV